jgi:rhodanese-related sulfurtransferase
MAEIETIGVRVFHDRPGPCRLIDVRTPMEYRGVHADGVELMPLDRFDAEALPKDEPVYLICKSGSRSRQAAQKLAAAGGRPVVVEGGTDAWVAAGLPHTVGQAGMSLERQVRIAAGSLVLIGVVLGFVLHPAFFGLSGFVGAGLVFAGVTDTCGMGLMLAKMPWNRAERPAPVPAAG